VSFQEQEFLLNGGHSNWFQGLENIPKKLVNLLEINQILAHQPWLLTRDHIAALVKGEDSWSIGELVHAILILCTFHALAGIVFACGVTAEVDFTDTTSTLLFEDSNVNCQDEKLKDSESISDTKKIMELLKGGWREEEGLRPEEKQELLFANAETTETSYEAMKERDFGYLSRYVGKYDMRHVDFDVKSKSYNIFRAQEYCWKEDGFELVRRFLPDAATLLDEEFDHIYNMTYNMFNESKDVDTFPFRRAIWQYIQRVKGIFHDDYNYQEVNVFLNRANKAYIKKIVSYPETITISDYQNLGYELRPDEKVHVVLLAAESARQSELLYGLHAIKTHMYT